MSSYARNYLLAIGEIFRERGVEARREREAARQEDPDGPGFHFQDGRCAAYWEVLSAMLNRVEIFHLTPEDLGLAGLNPDKGSSWATK